MRSSSVSRALMVMAVAAIGLGASPARGDGPSDKSFKKHCSACHTVEKGKNKIGPSLAGIVGRKAGTIEGFKYSDANLKSDVVWDEAKLDIYLEDPKKFMPGNKMVFPGVKKADERKEIIAYMKSSQ
ncbi:MAG: cytochrome c family protein [Alphaproteobacteria bacterium]|nr:cytochrome c family protein [Alphaproteobacteria bacterium]